MPGGSVRGEPHEKVTYRALGAVLTKVSGGQEGTEEPEMA